MRRGGPLSALLLALLASACASPTPAPRSNLDPLYHGATGEGEYEVDPATAALARRGPGRAPPTPPGAGPEEAQPCRHLYEQVDTHAYVDPETGFPSLCAVSRCVHCGRVVHDCARRWAR